MRSGKLKANEVEDTGFKRLKTRARWTLKIKQRRDRYTRNSFESRSTHQIEIAGSMPG